ncbi:MAG: serine protease [Magnetococcus sp. WYHC-3]
MGDLKNQQLVLLCLLVSFVGAMATSIFTVALLSDSPDPVSQTINRVVERTIEVVAPSTENKTVEKVITSIEDQVAEITSKKINSLVRIYLDDGTDAGTFISLGAVRKVDEVMAPRSIFADISAKYFIISDNKKYELISSETDEDGIYTRFKVKMPDGENLSSISFSDSKNLKLGQKLILLTGSSQNKVSTGIVSSMSEMFSRKTIETDLPASMIISGSLILDLNGNVVGMYVPRMELGNSFLAPTALPVGN